jgi:thioredoxin 1
MATKSVTDATFGQDVLSAEKPVLVDFWAEWCGPCRMIGPALEELSDELGDRVDIVKLNIDENPDAPTKYGVRGIPTMILFKNGQPAATKVGAEPKSRIQGWLEGQLRELAPRVRAGSGVRPAARCPRGLAYRGETDGGAGGRRPSRTRRPCCRRRYGSRAAPRRAGRA